MSKTKVKKQNLEMDSTYLLKMVIYLILGSFWVRFTLAGQNSEIPIPLGFITGIIVASHDKFQIDRKIEYAILLMAMFIGFWLPIGLAVSF